MPRLSILGSLNQALRVLLVGLSLWFIGLFIWVASQRLIYPFELEWVEDCVVSHIVEIRSGNPIYVQPTLRFVPLLYTPLFYYLSALVSLFTGIGFVAPRLVSIVATVGCFGLVFKVIHNDTRSFQAGIVAAGFYAAMYEISGSWYDVARVDSLFLFLVLLGWLALKESDRTLSLLYGSLLLTLAFFTKQTTAPIIISILCYQALSQRKKFAIIASSSAILLVTSTLFLNWITNGHYGFYTVQLYNQHGLDLSVLPDFIGRLLLANLPVALPLTALYLLIWLKRILNSEQPHEYHLWYLTFGCGAFIGSALSYLHQGGFDSALMPVYLSVALAQGLILGSLPKADSTLAPLAVKRFRGSPLSTLAVLCLLSSQYLLLLYEPANHVPDAARLAGGREVLNKLAAIPGDILALDHPYLAVAVGKPRFAHGAALADVFRGQPNQFQAQLSQEIREAIETKRFAAILLHAPLCLGDLTGFYHNLGPLLPAELTFEPLTGFTTEPLELFLPITEEPTGNFE